MYWQRYGQLVPGARVSGLEEEFDLSGGLPRLLYVKGPAPDREPRLAEAALARLQPQPGGPPLLVVATGPYAGEGFDCPALDTLFLATPVANKGSLTQYAGRILRTHENKTTAEVHDYLDERAGVLAAMLAKRAPGYIGLGFPDPRGLALSPSASMGS